MTQHNVKGLSMAFITIGSQGSFGTASKVGYSNANRVKDPSYSFFYPQPANGVTEVFVPSFSSDVGLQEVRAVGLRE